MSNHRLPRILSEHIISQKVYWAEEWESLCQNINFTPDNTNTPISTHWKTILNLLKRKSHEDNIIAALNSQFHDLYSVLDFNVTPLLASDFSSRSTSLIIKARGGLLDIKARSFKNNTVGICTMCNLDETENTWHFIGVCPIYKEFRLQCLGKTMLSKSEVICILNGSNFSSLCKYLEISLKYRKLIMNEFN